MTPISVLSRGITAFISSDILRTLHSFLFFLPFSLFRSFFHSSLFGSKYIRLHWKPRQNSSPSNSSKWCLCNLRKNSVIMSHSNVWLWQNLKFVFFSSSIYYYVWLTLISWIVYSPIMTWKKTPKMRFYQRKKRFSREVAVWNENFASK